MYWINEEGVTGEEGCLVEGIWEGDIWHGGTYWPGGGRAWVHGGEGGLGGGNALASGSMWDMGKLSWERGFSMNIFNVTPN